jgi:hypothetical protein
VQSKLEEESTEQEETDAMPKRLRVDW